MKYFSSSRFFSVLKRASFFAAIVFIGLTSFLSSRGYAQVTLDGSGGTSCAPLYQRWGADFHQENPDIEVNYQGVGSAAGITNLKRQLIKFASTDVPLSPKERAQFGRSMVMLPVTAGMIVLSYNLPGNPTLKLSRQVYTDIFLGKINCWNDPAITKLNPGVMLDELPITVVTRADGSGTTELVSSHFSAVSKEFATQVGKGKSLSWPIGISAKGNDGVTASIKRTPGAIGYIEYSYAQQNHLSIASLENHSGAFISPSEKAGSQGLQEINLDKDLVGSNPDPQGKGAYPIIGFNWLLFEANYPAPYPKAIHTFIGYALARGQETASSLGYLPLPKEVAEKDREAVKKITLKQP